EQPFAVVHGEVQRHALVPADELDQQPRQEVVAGADRRDVEPAARDALVLRHRVLGDLELLDDRADDAEQVGTGRGEVGLRGELPSYAWSRCGWFASMKAWMQCLSPLHVRSSSNVRASQYHSRPSSLKARL